MTPEQTQGILAVLVAYDMRHKSADELSARAKESVWAAALEPVDAEWCYEYVKREHRKPRPYALNVPDITGAWDHEQRRRQSAQRVGYDVDRPTPERIAEIRRAAGLRTFQEPKRKKHGEGEG